MSDDILFWYCCLICFKLISMNVFVLETILAQLITLNQRHGLEKFLDGIYKYKDGLNCGERRT